MTYFKPGDMVAVIRTPPAGHIPSLEFLGVSPGTIGIILKVNHMGYGMHSVLMDNAEKWVSDMFLEKLGP